jgi:hypothetical protein
MAKYKIATVDYVEAARAGSTIVVNKTGGTWPGPPTLRTDIVIVWKGADPSPPIVSARTLGVPGMLDNVDLRMIT